MFLGNHDHQFQIEESTGVVSVRLSPDREETPAFMLRVLALDSANNTVSAYKKLLQ